MNKNKKIEIINVIDIGTTKIIVLIADYDLAKNKIINIKGFGESHSDGLNKGVVVDINKTTNSIKTAIEIAEKQANIEILNIFVGISGDHIKGINYSGVTSINPNNIPQAMGHLITKEDVKKVLEQAKSINISTDRRIMHVLPQQYKIDNQENIKEPLGLSGHRLEAKVHLVTSSINTETNILTCLTELGIEITDFILEPLASSYAVLNDDERNLGSILIDIGGGTTDIITWNKESVLHTGVVPIGGMAITTDIAYAVQTSIKQAEKLKHNYGKAQIALASNEQEIVVKGVSGRKEHKISEKILAEVIEPRMVEIFKLINLEIEKSDYKGNYTFGIILTGGGSKLIGIEKLAEDIFKMPIKIGSSIYDFSIDKTEIKIKDPKYATAIGLVKYAGYKFNHYNDEVSWTQDTNSLIKIIKSYFKKIIQ